MKNINSEKIALTPGAVAEFQQLILSNYRRHGRSLPWRLTRDPYSILVSEIMLQQTQVDRVLPKYLLFMGLFPDFEALAAARLSSVLGAWSGLGYNRRAKALQECAAAVVREHKGLLPRTPEGLMRLPGIGPYTARAICSFAYNRPELVVETNIRAVYIHFFFPGCSLVRDSSLLPIIAKTLYRRNPRRWYNALMDYGAQLKKSVPNPARASAQHARQQRFEGSIRQARGRMLKILLEQGPCSRARLLGASSGCEAEKNLKALEGLLAEKLVVKLGRRIAIA